MNRWYLGVPLVGMLLFGVVYVRFERRFEAAAAAAEAAEAAARLAQQRKMEEARHAAIEQQRQMIEARRLAREEEQRREEAAAQLRAELERDRAKAVAQAGSDQRAIVVLEQKLSFEHELLQRVQASHERLSGEKAFLDEYVPVAVENQERLLNLLKDYRAAEAAREKLRQEELLSNAERGRR